MTLGFDPEARCNYLMYKDSKYFISDCTTFRINLELRKKRNEYNQRSHDENNWEYYFPYKDNVVEAVINLRDRCDARGLMYPELNTIINEIMK